MANVINNVYGSNVYPVYPSAARTATPDTMEFNAYKARYAVFVLDLTAFTTTASLTFKVEGVDQVSGKVYPILTGAAVAANSTVVYRVGPALTAAANLTVNDMVPPVMRVTVTHGNANSHTYSLSMMLS